MMRSVVVLCYIVDWFTIVNFFLLKNRVNSFSFVCFV